MTGDTALRISYSFARETGVVALENTGDAVRLGVREGFDPLSLIEVRRALAMPLVLDVLARAEFDRHMAEIYAADGIDGGAIDEEVASDDLGSLLDDMPRTADLLEGDDDAPIIRLINGLIAEAARSKASDIHVEPFENALSIRLRIDGVLQEILKLSPKVSPLLVSRIKVMARLDIAEKRIPQDGRISLALGERSLDVRVSTLPARHGERVVMRLLEKDKGQFRIEDLGMDTAVARAYRAALQEPNGIILVTGPTGSGKTTTLYGGLNLLNDASRNILTIEDPIEYAIEGIGQTQVNAKVGMTFAAGLRAILRQDPDVVMVGEIRDRETAQIAVQASLTGHLVLSSVHTNSAIAAITRLRDMGVEPFLLSSTLKAIMAQRLVRRLCPHCKTAHRVEEAEAAYFTPKVSAPQTLYRAVGCPKCKNTGYQGRIGIYEVVAIDAPLRTMIHDGAREADMTAHAFKHGCSLMESGLSQAAQGTTSLDEVLRVARAEGGWDGRL